jgi:antirestriction protein ArdC
LRFKKAETVFTKKYDTNAEKIAALHGELEKTVDALATDENWLNLLDTMSRFHNHSLYNKMLITMQRPDATLVAGFNKWKELERSVIKGETGIRILAPSKWTRDEKDATGKPKLDSDGNQVTRSGMSFVTVSVFDVSQTEGKPLPKAYEEMTEEPPAGFIEDLEASIVAAGFTVSYEKMPGAGSGFTDPETKRVVVDEALSPAGRARTLAHERGHIACGHLDRMDEYHSGHQGERGSMEVEAESFAYVVCRSSGMSTTIGGQSSTYVAGWAHGDTEAVRKSADIISKTVKAVLNEDIFVGRAAAREAEWNTENAAETAAAVAAWEVDYAIEKADREAMWAVEKAEKAAARAAKKAAA